jgi:hypothetical protein
MTLATDPNALAGYRRALAKRGQSVIVRRISGVAPNAVKFDARVSAIVMDYLAKPPVEGMRPEGEITLGARNVIVLADDLAGANFPLPVAKNDKVVINPTEAALGEGTAAGDEELNILSVDPNKRGVAGAIDIVAMGST